MEESLERIANVTATAAEALQSAVETHGELAVDLVLLAARLEAIQQTAVGLFFLGLILFVMLYIPPKVNDVFKHKEEERMLPYIPATIASFCLAIPVFVNLNLHSMVGMFYPEYYIAWKAIEAIL